MRSISVILFFYGANSTDKTVTEARIAFVGPCFLNARMLVANLTYRQKTISQRFNSVVIGLIVGLIVVYCLFAEKQHLKQKIPDSFPVLRLR